MCSPRCSDRRGRRERVRQEETRAAAGRRRRQRPRRRPDHADPPAAAARPRRARPRRAPLTEDEIFASKSLDALNAEKPLADAFFALDSAQIGDDAKPVLQKNADWMKRWTTTKVMVEGHADSRGTAEYNLALGERARQRRPRLPGQPRHRRRPDHDRQQGQGIAVLHRRERVLLAAEQARSLRDYGEVTVRSTVSQSINPAPISRLIELQAAN